MKKFVLLASAFLILSVSVFAQNNIQLKIYHKLGDSNFSMGLDAKNNIDHDFEVTRLQYYISEISITHDGGSETTIDDLWILADASKATQADLGDHNINTVEKISFYIGVDPDHNHLDPSTYTLPHPLAPQFPSMHWGWASGYRFIAYEGNGSSNFNQAFQLHGLGDANYFQTEVDLDLTATDNEIFIGLNADYARGLENIGVNSGVIVHGEDQEAKECLENFRDYVFTSSSATTSTVDFSEVNKFEVFPNPSNGISTINLESDLDLNYQISVTDVLGKQVQFYDSVNGNSTIDLTLDNAGFYFVNLIKEGQAVITKKLIAK